MRVLLVEDNEMNRDMLLRRLARLGHEVSTATDGREGIEAARRIRPEVVLMDMSLPEIDGWTATRTLKADAATSGIPVIALTAHATLADREKALEAGCDEFQTKPVYLDRLVAAMHALVAAQGGEKS